jgi:AraC-like DNA-binding protein
MGVRFRRFRVWNRLRAAIEVVLSGRTLTEAALTTGFTDSAHFARQYHEILGVTPSSVLRRVARAGAL